MMRDIFIHFGAARKTLSKRTAAQVESLLPAGLPSMRKQPIWLTIDAAPTCKLHSQVKQVFSSTLPALCHGLIINLSSDMLGFNRISAIIYTIRRVTLSLDKYKVNRTVLTPIHGILK